MPVVLVCTFILGLEFPYMPGGYYAAHTLYFAVAVAALAAVMSICLRRLAARRR
jgi:Mg2+ and Co2+ transporter CorA